MIYYQEICRVRFIVSNTLQTQISHSSRLDKIKINCDEMHQKEGKVLNTIKAFAS